MKFPRNDETTTALLEHALDLLLVLDERGLILFFGPSLPRLLGYPGEQAANRCLFDFVHLEDRTRVGAEFSRLCREATRTAFTDFRLRHADGTWRILEAVGSTVVEDDGTLRAVINARDVTDHRTVQEQLRHIQRVATLGRFVTSIVHEFNNAVQMILGNADFLLESAGDPSSILEIGAIKKAGYAAADLARQLLDLSRTSSTAIQLVDVNAGIESLGNALQRLLGQHLRLATRLAPESTVVLAPSGALDQVIINLVANARDAMSAGGTLSISTRTAYANDGRYAGLERGYVVIDVADNGSGMTPAVQARLFEPFFTTKPGSSGTGLGLSIVRSIVAAAGGAVEVQSEEGRGSTFSIFWPLADVALPHPGIEPSSKRSVVEQRDSSRSEAGKREKSSEHTESTEKKRQPPLGVLGVLGGSHPSFRSRSAR